MRLFVGLPVPASPRYDAVKAEVAEVAHSARLAAPGTEHVTLRFLGEVLDPRPVADALDAACKGRHALSCVVEGLGTFPSRFPPHKQSRVVWAGLRAAGIDALADAVVAATASFGEPPERRPFVAHVTLARLARPADLRGLVERHKATLFAQGALDRVVLFRSRPTGKGSVYEALHTVALG